MTAQTLAAKTSRQDAIIGKLRKKLFDKKNFYKAIKIIFRR